MSDILIVVEGGLVTNVYGVQQESFKVVYPGEGDGEDNETDAHRILAFLLKEGDSISTADAVDLLRNLIDRIGIRQWVNVIAAAGKDDSEEGAHSG